MPVDPWSSEPRSLEDAVTIAFVLFQEAYGGLFQPGRNAAAVWSGALTGLEPGRVARVARRIVRSPGATPPSPGDLAAAVRADALVNTAPRAQAACLPPAAGTYPSDARKAEIHRENCRRLCQRYPADAAKLQELYSRLIRGVEVGSDAMVAGSFLREPR
jgi:hypothetical protein